MKYLLHMSLAMFCASAGQLLFSKEKVDLLLSKELDLHLIYDNDNPNAGMLSIRGIQVPYTLTAKEQPGMLSLETVAHNYLNLPEEGFDFLVAAFRKHLSSLTRGKQRKVTLDLSALGLGIEFDRDIGSGFLSIRGTDSEVKQFPLKITNEKSTSPNLRSLIEVPSTEESSEEYVYIHKDDIALVRKMLIKNILANYVREMSAKEREALGAVKAPYKPISSPFLSRKEESIINLLGETWHEGGTVTKAAMAVGGSAAAILGALGLFLAGFAAGGH